MRLPLIILLESYKKRQQGTSDVNQTKILLLVSKYICIPALYFLTVRGQKSCGQQQTAACECDNVFTKAFFFACRRISVISLTSLLLPASLPTRKTILVGTWTSNRGNCHVACAKQVCTSDECCSDKSPKISGAPSSSAKTNECLYPLHLASYTDLWNQASIFGFTGLFARTWPCLKIKTFFSTNEYKWTDPGNAYMLTSSFANTTASVS